MLKEAMVQLPHYSVGSIFCSCSSCEHIQCSLFSSQDKKSTIFSKHLWTYTFKTLHYPQLQDCSRSCNLHAIFWRGQMRKVEKKWSLDKGLLKFSACSKCFLLEEPDNACGWHQSFWLNISMMEIKRCNE